MIDVSTTLPCAAPPEFQELEPGSCRYCKGTGRLDVLPELGEAVTCWCEGEEPERLDSGPPDSQANIPTERPVG